MLGLFFGAIISVFVTTFLSVVSFSLESMFSWGMETLVVTLPVRRPCLTSTLDSRGNKFQLQKVLLSLSGFCPVGGAS